MVLVFSHKTDLLRVQVALCCLSSVFVLRWNDYLRIDPMSRSYLGSKVGVIFLSFSLTAMFHSQISTSLPQVPGSPSDSPLHSFLNVVLANNGVDLLAWTGPGQPIISLLQGLVQFFQQSLQFSQLY